MADTERHWGGPAPETVFNGVTTPVGWYAVCGARPLATNTELRSYTGVLAGGICNNG